MSSLNHPSANSAGTALIVGCGYLGKRVAQRLLADGWEVFATTRKASRAKELSAVGAKPVVVDWTDRRSLRSLPAHDRILVAVAYDPHSSVSRYDSQVGGFRNLLQATDPAADLCYISTTGVYHQADGRWVDETSPCRPPREAGRVHLEAEQLLSRYRPRADWTVLRLAGIYGPQRVPRIADVVAGKALTADPEQYLNLIHVDDAAAIVMAAWRAGQAARRRYYVVSDGNPVLRGDFYRAVAQMTHSPVVRFENAASARPGPQRGGHKRIWNLRLQTDLYAQSQFLYNNYQQGLQSIIPTPFSSAESTT